MPAKPNHKFILEFLWNITHANTATLPEKVVSLASENNFHLGCQKRQSPTMVLVIATLTRTIWWALIFLDSNHFLNKCSSVKRSSLFITRIVGFTFYNHHKFSPRALPLADPWPAFWQLIETVHYSAYMYLYEFPHEKRHWEKKPWSKNQRQEPGLSQCTYIQIQWPHKHSHWIFHVLISHPLNPLRPSCTVKNIRRVAIVTC